MAEEALALDDQKRMRSDYRAESLKRCHRSVRFTAGLGTGLIFICLPFDYALPAPAFTIALTIRLSTVAALGVLFGLVHMPLGERHPNSLGFLTMLAPAVMILAMMVLTDWHTSTFFAALSILMLCSALMISWTPVWSGTFCGVIVLAYVTITIVTDQPSSLRFFDNCVSLIASAVLAVITNTLRERLHRSEFERRWSVAEAYRHKSEFFANVSHELRTPLHVMFGYIDMLLDGEAKWDDDDGRVMLQRVRSQGMNLHKLVSDLLDSAKVEAGKMSVHLDAISLPELTDQLTESFRPLVEEKGLQLSLHCAADLPAMVGDERKIRQVVTNLLANALKFTEQGSIRVDAKALNDISADEYDSFMLLSSDPTSTVQRRDLPADGVALLVTDTGIGIRRSELRTLAQDYTQAGGDEASKYGGTGLGLSLSRKLVDLMGGFIAVRSSQGVGSTFAVFLPNGAEKTESADQRPQPPRLLDRRPPMLGKPSDLGTLSTAIGH